MPHHNVEVRKRTNPIDAVKKRGYSFDKGNYERWMFFELLKVHVSCIFNISTNWQVNYGNALSKSQGYLSP